MRLPLALPSLFGCLWGLVVPACHAQALGDDGALCRTAIAAAEEDRRVPDAFLSAIARVESGRPLAGMVVPWPWTINAEGVGSFFATKTDAIAAVEALQARGVRSIDVGCLQVNLLQHPDAFTSLDQAFDPHANARYAADLLKSLFVQVGSWPLAAAAYHSQTPMIGAAYQRQVLAAWAVPDRPGGAGARAQTQVPEAAKAPSTAPGAAFGRQAQFVASAPEAGRPQATGRGLAAYRQAPVRLALRPLQRAG